MTMRRRLLERDSASFQVSSRWRGQGKGALHSCILRVPLTPFDEGRSIAVFERFRHFPRDHLLVQILPPVGELRKNKQK